MTNPTPPPEIQAAELEAAGWIRVRANLWKAPHGGYFIGPYEAWKELKSMEVSDAPTNPTPAEIVRLQCCIAERVMGWKRYTEGAGRFISNYYLPPDRAAVMVGETGATGWSPWNNAADALAVLKRVQTILQTDGGNLPDFWIRQWWEDSGEMYGVQVGDDFKAAALGPHYGPAVCRLAEKVMEGR